LDISLSVLSVFKDLQNRPASLVQSLMRKSGVGVARQIIGRRLGETVDFIRFFNWHASWINKCSQSLAA
jgi:hypothetical protein